MVFENGVQARDGWVVLERYLVGRGLAESHAWPVQRHELSS